ncbi:MAG: sugar ABC transporter ATP-binding protein [Halanaerobiaceae bacterium]
MTDNNILEIRSLNKSFPGVQALDNVDFDLRRGEIHALLGENGAGKSTFLNILSGELQPDSGTIYYEDREYRISNTYQARQKGISMAYQELKLAPSLSVAENILMGNYVYKTGPGKIIDWKKTYKKAEELLQRFDLDINPRVKLKKLGIGERQLVEIVRAVSQDIKVLLLDEPTSALSETEVKILFENIIARIMQEDVSVIYISHRLEETFEIADRVTVLRDGKKVKTLVVEETDEDELIQLMVGRKIDDRYVKHEAPIGDRCLKVENLTAEGYVSGCSLEVNKGEIVGLSGLMGSGRTELAKTMMGLYSKDSGRVIINGQRANINKPEDALRAGLGYLAESRSESLVSTLSVAKNITLANREEIFNRSPLNILNWKREREAGKRFVEELNIQTPNIKRKAKYLSGGNQQKVALAKWIYKNADVFILDEPTRGIDVGAKIEVYDLIGEILREGKGVLLISSELPEIVELCDRTYVMRKGKIVAEYSGEDITQENIMRSATGGGMNNAS